MNLLVITMLSQKKLNTYSVESPCECLPRVACTIVWQPWTIETATPMVLKHVSYGVINVNIHMDKWWIAPKRYNTYGVVPRKPYINPG